MPRGSLDVQCLMGCPGCSRSAGRTDAGAGAGRWAPRWILMVCSLQVCGSPASPSSKPLHPPSETLTHVRLDQPSRELELRKTIHPHRSPCVPFHPPQQGPPSLTQWRPTESPSSFSSALWGQHLARGEAVEDGRRRAAAPPAARRHRSPAGACALLACRASPAPAPDAAPAFDTSPCLDFSTRGMTCTYEGYTASCSNNADLSFTACAVTGPGSSIPIHAYTCQTKASRRRLSCISHSLFFSTSLHAIAA